MSLEIKYCNNCPAMKLYRHWGDGECDAICESSRNRDQTKNRILTNKYTYETKIEIPSWCWYLKKAMKEGK